MTDTPKRDLPAAAFVHVPNAAEWALSEDRVPVFTVTREHDDEGNPLAEPEVVAYTMPRKPNPGIALRFLKMARTMGDAASSWLIETAVGEDGYEALIEEFATLPDDADPVAILQSITEKIQRIVMGGLESPKA